MCRMKALLLIAFLMVLVSSCVNEKYDLSEDNLNLEITPFEEGVNLPLGKTGQIKLKDLIKDFDSDILDVGEDGSYSISFEDTFDASEGLGSLNEIVDLPSIEFSKTIGLPIALPSSQRKASKAQTFGFEAEVSEEIEVVLFPASSKPASLVSLGLVELEDTYLNITFDVSSITNWGNGSTMGMDFVIVFPDVMKVAGADADGRLHVSLNSDSKILAFDPIEIESFNFSKYDLDNDVTAVLKVDGVVSFENVNLESLLNTTLSATLAAETGTINLSKLTGRLVYSTDPIEQSVDLEELSSGLGDSGVEFDLNFSNAYIALDVNTNLTISAYVNVEVTPYADGVANTAKRINVRLPLEKTNSGEVELTRYWLAETAAQMPEGYVFVQADIATLLDDIPEQIDMKLYAETNEAEESVLEPSKAYTLGADYTICVPLELGESFKASYTGVVEELPEILGDLLSRGNTVGLSGQIINTLPLQLNIQFNLLDEDKNVVSVKEDAMMQVAPCNDGGSASSTDVRLILGLMDGVDASRVKSLEYEINTNAGGVIGVPIKEDAYIQAILQVALPSGITVNLEDILGDKEDEQ